MEPRPPPPPSRLPPSSPLSPPSSGSLDAPLPLWRSSPSSPPTDDTAGRTCFCRLLIRLEMGFATGPDGRQEEGMVPVIEQGDMEFLRLFRFLPYSALTASPTAAATASTKLLHGQRLSVLFGPATDLTRAQALLTACLRATTTGGEGAALLNLYTATRQVLSCRVTSRTLLRPEFITDGNGGFNVNHCLLLITPVCFWAYCKHPKLFATLHPFSPTAPERRPEDVVYDSNGKRKRRRRPRQPTKQQQQQQQQRQQQQEQPAKEATSSRKKKA